MSPEVAPPTIKVLLGGHDKSSLDNLGVFQSTADRYLSADNRPMLIVLELAQMTTSGSERIFSDVDKGSLPSAAFIKEASALLGVDNTTSGTASEWCRQTCHNGNSEYIGHFVDLLDELAIKHPDKKVLFLMEGTSESREEEVENFLKTTKVPEKTKWSYLYERDLDPGNAWVRTALDFALLEQAKRESVLTKRLTELVNPGIGLVLIQFGTAHSTLAHRLRQAFATKGVLVNTLFTDVTNPKYFTPRTNLIRGSSLIAFRRQIDLLDNDKRHDFVETIDPLIISKTFVGQVLFENLREFAEYQLYGHRVSESTISRVIYSYLEGFTDMESFRNATTGFYNYQAIAETLQEKLRSL